MTEPHRFLVFTNPSEGREDEFNTWYDKVHLRDVVAVPGITSVQRYELAPRRSEPDATSPTHRYLAVYELDGDPEPVLAEIARRVETGEMVISDSLDRSTVVMSMWSARGEAVSS
jgi:hypothetical protein